MEARPLHYFRYDEPRSSVVRGLHAPDRPRKSGLHQTRWWRETDSNPRSPVRRATLFETPVQLHPSRATCLGMLLCLPGARLLSLPDVPACGESVQASRRPETYRSRCSAFRRTQRSSTPTEILAASLSTRLIERQTHETGNSRSLLV